MKVLYDSQIYSRQKFGGVSRLYAELAKTFVNKPDLGVEPSFNLTYSNNEYLKELDFINVKPLLPKNDGVIRKNIILMANRLAGLKEIREQEYDIFQPTYFDPYFIKHIGQKPFVLMVYDMIHEKYPQYFPFYDQVAKRKKYLAHRADHIIAISQSTKDDIVEITGVKEDKVSVVHLATFLGSNSEADIEYKLPEKYFLYIGGRDGYKNFDLLLKAFTKIPSEIKLVVSGGGNLNDRELEQIRSIGLEDRIVYVPFKEDLISRLYSESLAFIYPSLYEGFGLPILEAFESNAPVILSRSSSFPEVAQDAGLYFDPKSETELVQQMKNVAEMNNSDRKSLINKGLAVAKGFSWEKAAIETAKVYQKVLS